MYYRNKELLNNELYENKEIIVYSCFSEKLSAINNSCVAFSPY